MPQIEDTKFKRHTEAETLYPIYIIYGDEKYLLKKGVSRLINKAKGDQFPEFNFNEFNSDANVDTIADAALGMPFMAERKCVTVSDFNADACSANDTGKLQELLCSLSETTVLIFFYPTMTVDSKKTAKWKNFFKLAEQFGASVCYNRRSTADIVKLLCAEAEKNGSQLSRANAEKIVEYAGDDLTNLYNEILKMSSFAIGREITSADIENMVTHNMESTVFMLSKAIIGGDYDRAYSVLNQLFYMNEEPVAILAVLSNSYVNMYRVKAALQSGKSGTAPTEYDPASYKGRDFILRNAERDGRSLSIEKLRQSLSAIMEADLLLKGSKISGRQVLEQLIAKLLLITKGEASK